MPSITSACNPDRFIRFAGQLVLREGGECLLSCAGHPAETVPVIGVRPVREIRFTPSTAPDQIKAFCFGSPGPAMGYVSYDYGMLLRGVASTKAPHVPLGHLKKYAAWAEYDRMARAVTLCADTPELLAELVAALDTPAATPVPTASMPDSEPTLSLPQREYEHGVEAALEAIRGGYAYQLNLSTRLTWHCPDLDPLALFFSLYREHPAPFYAWFRSGERVVLSTSPERFLRVRDGQVLSQPIKGTARVSGNEEETAGKLLASPKEDAELSMIVDLIRNDMATNCEYGSVRVDNHKSLFRVDDLLQMYSDVSGILRRDRDCLDVFFDAFPGGSVTGCPKQSAMEIIERLEPHGRGVYCGSMVVIRDERTMDSSIAIRTATFAPRSGRFDLYAGSGIVVDSDPAKEYRETMDKAGKFCKRSRV